MKIQLITFCGVDYDLPLLPHFIKHYYAMGIETELYEQCQKRRKTNRNKRQKISCEKQAKNKIIGFIATKWMKIPHKTNYMARYERIKSQIQLKKKKI